MSIAYVLMNVDTGKGEHVEQELKKMPEINDVYSLYGVYDYIVKLETDGMQELRNIISSKIRKIEYIRSTLTLIVIE